MSLRPVGNTPLERCSYLSKKYRCNIYIKKEYYNPSKSAKDRPALYMINDVIRRHRPIPGSTFVEASSGNTGIGIAQIAHSLNFNAVIFVSKSCSEEKLAELQKWGAQVIVCDNSNGISDKLSTQYRAAEYAERHENCYYTDQYSNEANYKSHFETTGPEIWKQSDGNISHFFAGVGTGGTISGVGRYLKKCNLEVKVYGVEPFGSVLSHYTAYGCMPKIIPRMDKISGIGRTFVPKVFDSSVVDEVLQVTADESRSLARDFYLHSGECIGFSSAAVLCGFDRYVEQYGIASHHQVVLLFADHGERYKKLLYADMTDKQMEGHANI